MRYRTVPLTAYPGQHYTAKSDTLVFAPGQTSTNIAVSEPSSTTIEAYRYQTGGRRSYRFDVTDEKGFPLASCDRSRQCGSIFSSGKLNSSVSSLVTLTSAGAFSSGMSSSKYVDVAYTPPSGDVQGSGKTLEGYVLIDDSYDYAQKPATVSTATLVDATGATGSYLASMGCKIHAAVCFYEKEKDDGYQYLQIVAGTSSASYDTGADPNGGVKDPTNSVYKVCFEFADGSNAEGNIYFPHRGTTSSEFSNSAGKLHQHKYKSGYGGSGAVVLPATTASITARFDAGGDNDDTWGYKDLFFRMALCDTVAPALYGGSSAGVVVAPGTYAVGSTVYVSVPFSEIVSVTGTPTLSTSWGTLSYIAGSGSNVLTFEGRIEAKPGDTLKINSLSGTVRDLAGNSISSLSINKTFSSCVSQIPWSGSGTPASPYLILTTGQLDALAIIVGLDEKYENKHFSLGADLAYPHATAWDDATSTENNYTPVGGYSKSFGGHFHGNGHVVSGIRIYRSGDTLDKGDSSLALFGYASGGSVRDVVVADANVSGYAYCGGVVGYNGAIVTNCLAFNVRVAGREASSAGAVAGYHDTNPSASRLLSNHYRDCTANGASLGIGTGTFGDVPGARSLHLLDLDPTVSASSDDTALVTNVLYYAAASSVSISYSGTPPVGHVLAGYATNSVALPDDVSVFPMPAADLSVAPRFKRATYAIEWRNDADAGSALLAATGVLYQDVPAYPADAPVPAKPSTAQFDYAFADAWSPAPEPATSNATYTALYTSALRSYDVVWRDGDGAPLLTNRLDYGSTPAYPAGAPVPAKSPTPQYTYAFAGSWSPAIAPVSGPAAYTAVFDVIPVTNGCCGLLSENGGSNLLWRVEDTDRNGAFDTLFVCTNPAAASGADFSMRDYGNSADRPWLHSVGTLERVVVCDGVATVGANAFSGFRSVRDVSFPESLVIIGSGAFSSCVALSSVSLPESIRTLGNQAFSGCTGLRRVDIPTGIVDIGAAAFVEIGSANDPAHVWYRGTETMWEDAGGPLALATNLPFFSTHAVLHLAAPVSVDPAISGGTVAADLAYAFEGETVTLSVVPADGFVVGAVGYATGSVLHAVAPAAGGVYAFAMPPAAATATATFRALVQFLDEDGATVLQSGLWDCGSTPAYTSAPPTKAASALYAYSFSGWTPNVAPVSGPASYTAAFDTVSHWRVLADALAAGGTVVLSRDVAATAGDTALTVPSGVAVTLDLAGHTIDRALSRPTLFGEAIRVEGSLALTNSVPASGAITCGISVISYEDFSDSVCCGGVRVADGGAFTMNGGAISGNAAAFGGGVHVDDGGTFTMTGGTISGNSAAYGGGVHVNCGGAFTMTGGAISGNSAGDAGGGIFLEDGGAFAMSGGTISGNAASSDGGGVLAYSDDGFAMSGGEISGNAAGGIGGGVYLASRSQAARLPISGAPRVLGNVVTNFSDAAAPAAANDIDFSRPDSLLQVVGDLAPGARLGIVPDVRRAVTTNLLGHAAGADGGLSLFFSDDPEYALALDADGEVGIVPPTYALSYAPQDHVAVTVWSVTNSPEHEPTNVADLALAPASFEAAYSPGEPFAIRLDFDPGWFLDLEDEDFVRLTVAGGDESGVDVVNSSEFFDGVSLYLVTDGPRAPATLALSLAPFSRTVAFRDYDGAALQSGPVDYGVLPAYTNATPSRAVPDPDHYYAFAGWSPALAPVVPDLGAADPAAPLVYTATYELRNNHAVVVDPAIEHGTVEVEVVIREDGPGDFTISPYTAPVPVGTEVRPAFLPDPGYGLASWSVVDTNGVPVEVDEWGQFAMPASDVTVSAVFAEALPISVEVDESVQVYWSVYANGIHMIPAAAAPGATVALTVFTASFLLAPTAVVTTESGAAVASEVVCPDESYPGWAVSFTMPAEPVVVSLSAVPATFDSLVLLPDTNTVDAASRVFSFVPVETGVYRFAMDGGYLGALDCRGEYFFAGEDEASGALLAGETYYVCADIYDWDGTPRPLVAERTDGTFTPYAVAIDPDIAHGTVSTSLDSAPEGHPVYATPVPAPGYAYVEGSLRYIVGDETNELSTAYDGTPCFRMPAADVVVTAEFEPIPFAVTVDPDIAHGTVRVYVVTSGGGAGMFNHTEPYSGPVAVGTRISLRTSPDAGYGLVSRSIVDTNGVPVEVDEDGYFAMPPSDVTVSATFAEALPISVRVDESAPDAISYWSVRANGVVMEPAAAVPGAAVEMFVCPASFVFAPTATVATASGAAVACEVLPYDESSVGRTVSFTMPAEPVVVSLSVAPATFDSLVLLPATNTVNAESRVFSFVPEETGVYRFAMDDGFLGVVDCRGEYFFAGEDEASGALLAGETYYVHVHAGDWDGTPRPLVAERTGGTFTPYAVAVDPDIAHGTVSTSHDSAPEYHPVYATPVPAPGYAYVEGTLRYIVGGETNELSTAYDGTPFFRIPAADVVVTAEFEPIPFAVTVDPDIEHGWIWLLDADFGMIEDTDPVFVGTKIWAYPVPDRGYGVVSLSVVDTSGAPVEVDEWGQFAMPASDVTVSATFAEALPVTVRADEAAQDAIRDWSVSAGGIYVDPGAAAPGAAVAIDVRTSSFLLAPTAVVATTDGAEVPCETDRYDEASGEWYVRFTMPAEPVVVTLSAVPATFDPLVLLTDTNAVDAVSRVFSFVPDETGVYRFAMDEGDLSVLDRRGGSLFSGTRQMSGVLLEGETCYVSARIRYWDWDGTPRPLVAEKTAETPVLYPVDVDPSIVGGTVSTSLDSAPEGHLVYATPVPAPGYAYVEGSLRYIDGGSTYRLSTAYDGTPYFRMPASDVVVTAEFEPRRYAVVVDPTIEHGTVEVNAWVLNEEHHFYFWREYSGPVPAGTQIQLSASPDPGYGFVHFSVADTNGVSVAVDEWGYFTMPASDVTVSATFAEALPITVLLDAAAQDAIDDWSVSANGIWMNPPAAASGAAVSLDVSTSSFLFAPTVVVATTNGNEVACDTECYDEANGFWYVRFTMPAEPVVVSLSAVPATFEELVLLPATNTVDKADRVFSFVPQETGVYRFAMDDSVLGVYDRHGESLFYEYDETSGTLLAGETYYVYAVAGDWDGTPRFLVAEKLSDQVVLYSVSADPSIAHGTVVPGVASAPEGIYVYATPVPAPGYAYKEGSLRSICGGEATGLGYAPDGTPCFRMPADDVLVTAEFEPIPFAVTVDPTVAHGSVDVWAAYGLMWSIYFDPVPVGTQMQLIVDPEPGYGFVSWSAVDTNGVPVEVDEDGYFAMPPSDVTVSATFAEALPISVRVDESAPDAISYWSVRANGVVMEPAAAVPGAAVEMFVCPASFVFAPTATVATASGAAVACEVLPYDESSVGRTVSFTMPAEPVVVSLSVVPATFDTLVLLPGTNTVDAESRVFSFVPEETGVYRFAMNGGHLSVSDCRGTYLFWGDDEASGVLLAGETCYVRAEINPLGWDGTPRSLVAERTDGTVTLHSVAVDPDIAHGMVETSLASAPEGIYVYVTPVPAPGWAYVEYSLRYVCGGETNGLDSAPDGTPCFRMPADDVLVTAEFEPRRYAVAVDPAVAHGTVWVYENNGYNWAPYTGPVLPGTGVGVDFEPDPGYGLVSWSVVDTNGVPVEVGEWGEFAMPASDVTVSAVVARTKSISVEEDEAAKRRITYWQCYANDIYMDPAAAVPGAAVELSIGMQSFVFAPTATVATAGGAAIAATVERVNVLDYDGWSVRFTMPAEPVVVSLSAVPADYPALHEGVNVVDPPYRDRTFSFTPETTGYYSFVAAGSNYFGVVDSFEEGMGLPGTPGGMCSVPFLAGERYYVLYGEQEGATEHTIVISMVGDPVATYAVAVDPSIAGGTVTPSVLRAAEGCRVHLAVAEEADSVLGTLRATWTNGTETVELEIGEGAFGEAYFTMPAGDVAVTAEFPRARLLSVVTDAKTRLYHIFANERDYDDTASVKVAPNTEVAVVFWCPTGYELLVDVATAAGETVPSELDRDNCLTFTMPDAPVVATVSTVRKNLPALVVGDNAVDASAKTFSFAPSETAEYRFASENGYMQAFDDQGGYMDGERNSLSLVLLGGKTYFVGYSYQKTWDGTPQNLLVEKLGTAVQLYRVSVDPGIVGGTVETSVTNAPRWHPVYLRPVPASGYAYVEGSIAVRCGSDVFRPDDSGDGTFVFTLNADATVTALFDPLPFSFPPYLDGADDAVLTNYVNWAAVHGPDYAGTQAAAFLLNVAPSATPTELRIDGIEVGAEGATIRASATAGGAAVDLTKINGILAVEAGDTVTNLVPKAVRGATFSADGTTATIPVPSSDGFFLRARIGTSAP